MVGENRMCCSFYSDVCLFSIAFRVQSVHEDGKNWTINSSAANILIKRKDFVTKQLLSNASRVISKTPVKPQLISFKIVIGFQNGFSYHTVRPIRISRLTATSFSFFLIESDTLFLILVVLLFHNASNAECFIDIS